MPPISRINSAESFVTVPFLNTAENMKYYRILSEVEGGSDVKSCTMLLKIIAIGIEYYGYSHAVLFYMKWIMSDVDAKLHSWIINFQRYEIY